MRAAGAMAGMASAAMLLAPGCGREDKAAPSADEPLRRANFRSHAARELLIGCSGGEDRAETAAATGRHGELIQLGVAKRAEQPLALGENDWNAVRRYDRRGRCRPGEPAYAAALAAYRASLDTLAARIADHGSGQ